ncbi:MAG: nitroreductase family protein [Candidatus Heimdallarchaeota archaeon]
MSIIGIDYNKCSNCKVCLSACILYRFNQETEKIEYKDSKSFCNLCGQCIARCPEDAILHENLGTANEFQGVDKPEEIISYDKLYDFLRAHRSVRRYRKRKVPYELLRKVFNAMSYAPTGDNLRSEAFSIISEQDQIKELNDVVIQELLKDSYMKERYGNLFTLLGRAFHSPIYFDAPHIIFVSSPQRGEVIKNNIGIIITYGRLAAQTLGLGTCWNGWTQIAMRINPEIKNLANIEGESIGVFIIGYPAIKFHRSAPRTLKQVTGLSM